MVQTMDNLVVCEASLLIRKVMCMRQILTITEFKNSIVMTDFIPKWSPSGIGITISSKGNVYVTDSGKQITEFVPYPLSYNYTKDIKPMLPAQAPHAGISDQF